MPHDTFILYIGQTLLTCARVGQSVFVYLVFDSALWWPNQRHPYCRTQLPQMFRYAGTECTLGHKSTDTPIEAAKHCPTEHIVMGPTLNTVFVTIIENQVNTQWHVSVLRTLHVQAVTLGTSMPIVCDFDAGCHHLSGKPWLI